jgi:putative ABC transport system substrate-binding protein
LEQFRAGLQELGYVEKKTILMEHRYAEGNPKRLPSLAGELVDRDVAVIVTTSTEGALAAKRVGTDMRIVMIGIGDPVEAGLVASLARPGGNVTVCRRCPQS